jgi:hypothetical protein
LWNSEGPHVPSLPRDQFGSLIVASRATSGFGFGAYARRDHFGRSATILAAPFDKRKGGVALRRTSAPASGM